MPKAEKDFYKIMNNSNFSSYCRNNTDNCYFTPIYDEIEEVSYIQRYASLCFNNDYKDFACPETIKQQIEQEYNFEMMKIQTEDPCAETKEYFAGQKRAKKCTLSNLWSQKQNKKKI